MHRIVVCQKYPELCVLMHISAMDSGSLCDCTSHKCAVQALESLLNNYKARHVECMHGKMMPGKYIVVEMWDEYAGLGNQFPSIITGAPEGPSRLEALQNLLRHCMTLLSL